MAEIVAPATGTKLPTDRIGDVDYPKSKMVHGADGTATDITDATPLPVQVSANAPIESSAAVVPSDATPLTTPSRALYVGVAGDLTVRLEGDADDRLFKAAAVGYHPLRVSAVRATGTTATNIVALY